MARKKAPAYADVHDYVAKQWDAQNLHERPLRYVLSILLQGVYDEFVAPLTAVVPEATDGKSDSGRPEQDSDAKDRWPA